MVPPTQATAVLQRLCGLERLGRVPSTMLVLAHPDDESVGAASLIPALGSALFVYVTDGAPLAASDAAAAGFTSREAYADVRRGELLSALESAGIGSAQLEFVGCIDQQASLQLVVLARWIEILMREYWPALVLTHPYEGGHPDHDATAFAVHEARRRLHRTGAPAPVVAEFTSYHAVDGEWRFGEFLPGPGETQIVRTLTPGERALKRRLLGCYRSQAAVLREVPLDVERFRVAPEYDFEAPPHPGQLLYERHAWGMTGEQWRAHARTAAGNLRTAAAQA